MELLDKSVMWWTLLRHCRGLERLISLSGIHLPYHTGYNSLKHEHTIIYTGHRVSKVINLKTKHVTLVNIDIPTINKPQIF